MDPDSLRGTGPFHVALTCGEVSGEHAQHNFGREQIQLRVDWDGVNDFTVFLGFFFNNTFKDPLLCVRFVQNLQLENQHKLLQRNQNWDRTVS